jgi:hypothetical protein
MPHLLDAQITQLTGLLRAARRGDKAALDDLLSPTCVEQSLPAHVRLSAYERTTVDTHSFTQRLPAHVSRAPP